MKEPKELSPIEAAKEIEYELLTQKVSYPRLKA